MKHIIIGGSGFTGRHLAERLGDLGETVLIIDITDRNVDQKFDFQKADITKPETLENISLQSDDIIHHMAARVYDQFVPHFSRQKYFDKCNVEGTANVLEWMEKNDCGQLIFFSTDMVYGIPNHLPITTDHGKNPLGPYGRSKMKSEELCFSFRKKGFRIPIFRPRFIVGPGRLGILVKLFKLIDAHLPLPMIGSGNNHYQMISVFDCVSAIECVLRNKLPNMEFNLGSTNPPMVKKLLGNFIKDVGSRTKLVPTPAIAIKAALSAMDFIGFPLMYPEQFKIADIDFVVDISTTMSILDWKPRYSDEHMLKMAFDEYKANKIRSS